MADMERMQADVNQLEGVASPATSSRVNRAASVAPRGARELAE